MEVDIKISLEHLRPWSFSKVQKAKRCQYEFYWTYVEPQEPAERAEFLLIGNGVHFILENALETVFKRKRPLNYDLLNYFLEKFRTLEPSIKKESVKPFFPNILRYANAQLRRIGKLRFYHSELSLSMDREMLPLKDFEAKEVFLRGKLDFVFGTEDTLYIVDHKTNRNRDFSNRIKTQLRWYALLASSFFPEFERFALEVHNVRYGTVNRFIFTRSDVLDFKLRLIPLIDMLEEEFLGKSIEELLPSPHSTVCRWCDFRHICPQALI